MWHVQDQLGDGARFQPALTWESMYVLVICTLYSLCTDLLRGKLLFFGSCRVVSHVMINKL